MSKILSIFFSIFLLFITTNIASANDYLKIIPRNEWWANEEYRYWNSSYWSDIFVKRAASSAAWKKKWANYSQATKDSITAKNRVNNAKFNKMNAYLTNNFYNDIKIVNTQRYDSWNKLAWQYSRTEYVKNIVVHHTYSDYESSAQWIKDIHKYHALSRQWWDIGYHYIIWYDGEVYEWRAGWDYVIASHDTWNNRSTVWISIMWNYDVDHLKDSQYDSLKKLISHLTKKYWIDLNTKIPYHKECFWDSCTNWLETKYYYPIVWHKDWKATSCPWQHIYEKIIPKLISELQAETAGYKKVSYTQITGDKKAYTEKINALNWSIINKQISSFSTEEKIILIKKLNNILSYELDWKKEILYRKLLEEIN